MMRTMLQAKLHMGRVTRTELSYPGSLTVDRELIEKAGMLVHQQIQLVNVNNGIRLETYLIPGDAGGREIIVNGAAARHAQPGDRVIVIAYALYDEAELADHRPTVVILDEENRVVG